jgi:hypothetical protein
MKQELTQAIASSAGTLVASTGIATILLKLADNHAAGIGAISTIVFGCFYLYFQWSSNQKLTIAETNKIEIDDLREETRAGFNKVDNALNHILEKLG